MVDDESITILQLNDSHGYFEIHPELFRARLDVHAFKKELSSEQQME